MLPKINHLRLLKFYFLYFLFYKFMCRIHLLKQKGFSLFPEIYLNRNPILAISWPNLGPILQLLEWNIDICKHYANIDGKYFVNIKPDTLILAQYWHSLLQICVLQLSFQCKYHIFAVLTFYWKRFLM